MQRYRFEIVEGTDSLWYWRLRAGNNRIVADGAEGYASASNAIRAAKRLHKALRDSDLEGWEHIE
jgi:uncharacterized protein YegP (UPF0339 family)